MKHTIVLVTYNVLPTKFIDFNGASSSEMDLSVFPLYNNQHSYITDRSTDLALHQLVTKVEDYFGFQGIALCTFLNIEGPFKNTTMESSQFAAYSHGNGPSFERWITSRIGDRLIITNCWENVMA